MTYLIFALSCVAGALFLGSLALRRETTAWGEPARVVFGAVALGLAALLITWRASPLLAIASGLSGAWLMGWFDGVMTSLGRSVAAPQPGRADAITTDFLDLLVDRETGAISGAITKGIFAGRELHSLRALDVALVWHDCRFVDPTSADLIERYLDRLHPTWREDVARGEREMRDGEGRMQPQQAFEILGLTPPATEDEIRRAHRDLMLRLHPDRGGSTYLSAQVNEAKDVLLAALGR